jgi:heme a synthase
MSRFSVSPAFVRKAALVAVICYALLVLTGGAVRLTGSGLGCPDWPSCFATHFTAESSIHGQIEFDNRLVTVAATVISIAVFLATLARSPRRTDLCWLGSGMVFGVLAQIILGGLVVLFKLNPYLVSLHFLLTLVIIAVALVLFHRAGTPATPAEPLLARDLVWLSRIVLIVLGALVWIGTVVTGSGPHAGSKGTKRYPIAFRDITEAHSTVALFLIGMTLAMLFALHHAKAPQQVQRLAQRFLEILFLQGIVGYTQYFLHDAAGVIEIHLAGATLAWITGVSYYLSLHRHPSEDGAETLETEGVNAPA